LVTVTTIAAACKAHATFRLPHGTSEHERTRYQPFLLRFLTAATLLSRPDPCLSST